MTTIEQNKLIAEFIGLKIITDGISLFDTNYRPLKQYHKDWNALMEVVERIEGLGYSIEINKQEEHDYQCLVVKKDILIQEFSNTKIEAVYNACIEFINWYNKQG